jgi:hypothetical protein
MVGVSAPVLNFELAEGAWQRIMKLPDWRSTTLDVRGAEVRLSVRRIGPQLRAGIEWNPARVLDPSGYSLCAVSALGEATAMVMTEVGGLVKLAMPPESARLVRLDVSRDFYHIANSSFFIMGLLPLPRSRTTVKRVHVDPRSGEAQTLEVGSKSGGFVKLYDKHAESSGLAPRGTLRWEATCRKWASRYGGMYWLRDVSENGTSNLARNRWEWSLMGTAVTGDMKSLVEAVEELEGSNVVKSRVLGDIFRMAAGVEVRMSNSRASSFHAALKQLGVTPNADLLGPSAMFPARRLDFDSGTEVVEKRAPRATAETPERLTTNTPERS